MVSTESLSLIIAHYCSCCILTSVFYRGDQFRKVYAEIAQLKAFVPTNTPFLALTATASNTTQSLISHSLRMDDPLVIAVRPDRPNIHYSVQRVSVRDVTVPFQWLAEELKKERRSTTKTVVFCRSIAACIKLYKHFLTYLRDDSYEPKGATHMISNRLFAMYHARVDDDDRQTILSVFRCSDSVCRILFSTVAFGMGVDIPDIHRVIHYGPPGDIESYFQESGRAGRDGKHARALLYLYPGSLLGYVDKSMKAYCNLELGKCRRKELLKYFPGNVLADCAIDPCHFCCDGCVHTCECGEKHEHIKLISNDNNDVDTDDESSPTCVLREVTEQQRHLLRCKLMDFRSILLLHSVTDTVTLYVGEDLACGLPVHTIDTIVQHCEQIHSVSDLEELCGIWQFTDRIINIIEDVFDD